MKNLLAKDKNWIRNGIKRWLERLRIILPAVVGYKFGPPSTFITNDRWILNLKKTMGHDEKVSESNAEIK